MNNFTKKSNILTIILNWNTTNDTIECISSLNKADTNTDILIIDNGSVNKQLSLLEKNICKQENILLLKNNANIGFAAGNNQGIKFALEHNYEFILLLNNDTVVKNDFLDILISQINKEKIAIAAPKIYYYKSEKIWHTGGKINKYTIKANGLYLEKENQPINSGFDFVSGCCMLIKSKALKEIGLFNEKYFAYLEDLDFCQRTLKKGWKISYVPQAIIWHKVSQSTGGSAFKPLPLFLRTRNRIIYQKENANTFTNILFFFYHSVFVSFFIIYGIFTFKLKISKAVILGFISGYLNKKLELPNF